MGTISKLICGFHGSTQAGKSKGRRSAPRLKLSKRRLVGLERLELRQLLAAFTAGNLAVLRAMPAHPIRRAQCWN